MSPSGCFSEKFVIQTTPQDSRAVFPVMKLEQTIQHSIKSRSGKIGQTFKEDYITK